MTQVRPTTPDDLPEVGRFLHERLGRRFTPEAWIDSLQRRWTDAQPNHGMHLRHEGQVVGVLCAIYSDQLIDGRLERFCNPHSWVVLEEHRAHSIHLVLQLIRQRDYHFTMFTPNPKVAQVFAGLRFRTLDESLLYIPHLPGLRGRGDAESRRDHIGALLQGVALRDFEAHRHLPWLEFVAFGTPGDMCLAIYKPTRIKRLPAAAISYVSDPEALQRHGALLQQHLLRRRGIVVSRIEGRFLARPPRHAIQRQRTQPKLASTRSLADGQIRDVYSELMALDL